MDRAFMKQYFEMAYEDLHGELMRESAELKEAHATLRKSIDQLFSSYKIDSAISKIHCTKNSLVSYTLQNIF